GVRVSCPVCASHTVTVWSLLPDTIRLPSAENATLLTVLVCPLRVSASCPVCASHTFTVWSSLPDTIRLPSAENATMLTHPVCPLRVSASCPVCASHTFPHPLPLHSSPTRSACHRRRTPRCCPCWCAP